MNSVVITFMLFILFSIMLAALVYKSDVGEKEPQEPKQTNDAVKEIKIKNER